MAYKKVKEESLVQVADAIREQTGNAEQLSFPDGFVAAVGEIPSGRGEEAPMKDVNFYDYDGFRVYSYTLEEAQALDELPPGIEHDGLVFQEWNWTLAGIKSANRFIEVGANYITDDGNTRVYVELDEGRTTPMIGLVVNGTAEIDWGDGTENDTIVGTATTQSYENTQFVPHEYAKPGDYKITIISPSKILRTGLLEGGAGGFFCSSNGVGHSHYMTSIKKIEMGENFVNMSALSMYYTYNLSSISIPKSITTFASRCFSASGAQFVVIPNNSTLDDLSFGETNLCHVVTPERVSGLGSHVFHNTQYLHRFVFPEGISAIPVNFLTMTRFISSVVIPSTVTYIGHAAFQSNTTKIYDFTRCTTVPTLSGTVVFADISSYCEIRVPASLYDEWIAATNWSAYASNIVGV